MKTTFASLTMLLIIGSIMVLQGCSALKEKINSMSAIEQCTVQKLLSGENINDFQVRVPGRLFLIRDAKISKDQIFLSDDLSPAFDADPRSSLRVQQNVLLDEALRAIASDPDKDNRCVLITGHPEKPSPNSAYFLSCYKIEHLTKAQFIHLMRASVDPETYSGLAQ